MSDDYKALTAHLTEVRNIDRAIALLGWDQQVNMPPGGAEARAAQLATLTRIKHELFTGETTARLLDAAARTIDAPDDSDEARMIRVVREDYDQETRLPADFVVAWAQARALSYQAWVSARANNDFAAFLPHLERLLDLTHRRIEYLGYRDHPYDALINVFERGITTAQVRALFDGHKPQLIELIAAVRAVSDRVSDAILHQPFAIDRQRAFATDVVKAFGYDYARGRQDVAVHPFAIRFSRGDARITTRFTEDFLNPALFGMMHEAGHAMYEQGIAPAIDATPLGQGTSLGVHESQSRMWENLVGRSRAFWTWALPLLQRTFPGQFDGVDVETFYRAINKVTPGYIRVEADEATYNLHIMLRFELETALVTGEIAPRDLPDAWNARFEQFFGMTPPTDALGVLQDIHWSQGMVGYFPTYALGNLLSVQFWNQALAAHPTIPDEIAEGKFDTLLGWLNTNIHQHGRKFTSDELTRRVTGESIQSRDYMAYLEAKFRDVYGL